MNSKMKRDSKDPEATASNSQRKGGGNDPAPGGEKVGSGKAERVSVASRFDSKKPGPDQPRRQATNVTRHGRHQSGGNLPALQAVEDHGQKKAEHVKASQRF